MPIVCAAVTCKNRGCCAAKRKIQNPSLKISWHRFPLRNPDLLAKWLENLPRRYDSWMPRKHDYLCSQHFKTSCYEPLAYRKHCRLKPDAVPTEFVTFDKSSLPKRRNSKKKKPENALNVLAIVAESELANICHSDMLTDVAEVLEIESEEVSANGEILKCDSVTTDSEIELLCYYSSEMIIPENNLRNFLPPSEFASEANKLDNTWLRENIAEKTENCCSVLPDHLYCLTYNAMKQKLDNSTKEVSALKQKLRLCEARLKRKELSVQSLKEKLVEIQTMIHSTNSDFSCINVM